ncbi:MAG: ankyrin repeat domain-containing protein, partial [Acidobacteria bacterium]|nr:ankyrin repeat domain-containing protein [Acidobacteriota bacterium]
MRELAEPLGLEDAVPRPATSASSHAYSYMTRRDRQLSQLLHLAIDKGNEPAVLELLQQGADPSMLRPGSLLSPLHRALDRGNEYIATLMAAGVDDVNEPDPDANGRTPLMKGAMHGFTDKFIAVMCELGSEVESVDDDGGSALHHAASADRDDDTVGILVLGGADANLRDRLGHTPLSTAVSSGCYHSARLLLEFGADLEARLPDGRSVLHQSILRKDRDLCGLIIRWGADLNEDLGDHTPLTLAIATGCVDIAQSLIEACADVDQRSTSGNTPLLTAISSDHAPLASILIDRNASLDIANSVGYRPIHMAARRNSVAVLRHLVASGSPVDPVTNDAETPLCVAVKFRNQESVDLLIDVGADVNHRVSPADTVFSLALDAGDRTAITTLVNSGADAGALLVYADGSEGTPMHGLAEGGQTETLRVVLGAGAEVEARAWPGYTPLFAAVRAGQLASVKLLVERGADLEARSIAGESVLFVCTAHLPVLKFLLSLDKVNVNHRDHYGATALHHAGIHGRMGAVKVLMGRGARSVHANVVYDSLEDFGVGKRYR